jgi:hypothetical protein
MDVVDGLFAQGTLWHRAIYYRYSPSIYYKDCSCRILKELTATLDPVLFVHACSAMIHLM